MKPDLVLIRNGLIVLCAAVLLTLWSVMMAQYKAYDKVSAGLEVQQAELEARKKDIADIKSAMEKYKSEKEEFAKLLFNERDVPSFLDQISDYAKKANINILDMKTQQFFEVRVPDDVLKAVSMDRRLARQKEEVTDPAILAEQTLSAMPIQIRVKGTYASFIRFLDHLQEYKQLINIANVEIRAGSEYPLLNCDFIIRIYTLKTKEELKRR